MQDVIPASTPVIIRCNSSNPTDNKIEPVNDNATFNQSNCLQGVYCALSGVAKHFNAKEYDPVTMRVIGLDNKGELAFITAKPENLYNDFYLRANKAYLRVDSGTASTMTKESGTDIQTITRDEFSEGTYYTLNGVRVPEGSIQRPGIYILRSYDGTTRKVIIK